MYKCAKTLTYLAFVIVIPALLSACGGAPTEDTSSQPSGATDLLEANSKSPSAETSNSQPASTASQSAQPQSSSGVEKLPTAIQLQLYRLSESSITLIWNEATSISYYEISRNGEFVARVDYPSYSLVDQGLTPNTNYNYIITAFDLTGKESGSSQTFTMRTLVASGDISSKPSLGSQPDSSVPSIGTITSASPKSTSNLSSGSFKSSSSLSLSSISAKSSSSLPNAASSTSSASSVGEKPVTISWNHPNQRENGTFLQLDEIGGYQIRYRKPTDTSYTHLTLNGNRTTEYTFSSAAQDLEFEIAVFDTTGLYSPFVKVSE